MTNMNIKQKVVHNLKNMFGCSVKKIESDDWGSICIPSLKALDAKDDNDKKGYVS